MSLCKGKPSNVHFVILGEAIATIQEEPVKNLRSRYTLPLTHREGSQGKRTAHKGFKATNDWFPREVQGVVFSVWFSAQYLVATAGAHNWCDKGGDHGK